MRYVSSSSVAAVRVELGRAFAGVAPVAPEQLSYAPTHPDVPPLIQAIGGMRWGAIAPSALLAQRDAIGLLSPEAFHAYLPAFLATCLELPLEQLDVLWDNVIINLTPPLALGAAWVEKARQFSIAQHAAVLHCLELMGEEERAAWPSMPLDADRVALAVERWRSLVTVIEGAHQ